MRNIIAITVLFSLIATFANFDIVRVLTRAGRSTRPMSSRPAFKLGIESGDIPLSACVSLFMVPILGVATRLHPA
jgi:multiple sugar transport system permease protein